MFRGHQQEANEYVGSTSGSGIAADELGMRVMHGMR